LKEYIIIKANSRQEMELKINDKIKQGYQLHGSFTVALSTMFQAMVKCEEDKTYSRENTSCENKLLDELNKKDEKIHQVECDKAQMLAKIHRLEKKFINLTKDRDRLLDENNRMTNIITEKCRDIVSLKCCGNCEHQLRCLRTYKNSHAIRLQGVGVCRSWRKSATSPIVLET